MNKNKEIKQHLKHKKEMKDTLSFICRLCKDVHLPVLQVSLCLKCHKIITDEKDVDVATEICSGDIQKACLYCAERYETIFKNKGDLNESTYTR